MLRTIKRQAGGTATTKTGFKTTTKGTPVIINGKTVYLSDDEYKAKYPTLATVSKKDPELYIKPPLKEVEVVATKPSWMKNREEAEKLPEYSFDKFKENVLPNWAGALGVTKDTMSDETKQQRQDWIDKNYVAPKLFAENKGYYEYSDKEKEILDKSNLPDWLKRKEQDITNTSNKLQKEKGVIGSLRTPEDMAKVANATQYRFNTGNKVIDTVNPLTGLAGMATNLGNARLDVKKGNTGKAFASIITPVIAGAAFNLAGKQSNAQFVADNLSPIPVNADKVVQSVRNYTKSIPKPLLRNIGNRKLVDQVIKGELRLPRLQQTSNTDLNIPTTEELRTMIQNRESSLNRNPLPNSGTDNIDYHQLRNTPSTYNRQTSTTQNIDYTRTANTNIDTERFSRELSALNPNLETLTTRLRTTTPTTNLVEESKNYVKNLVNEANDVFKTNFESGKSNRHYFVDDTPDKSGSLTTYYIDANGVKQAMGSINLSTFKNKQSNGAFNVNRLIDFPTTLLPSGSPYKKGVSYDMSQVFNDLQKQKGVGFYSSISHTKAGEKRYLGNLLTGKVKVSDRFNNPHDIKVMNKELEKAKKEFNLSSGQRPTEEQIEKFKKNVSSLKNINLSNFNYVKPSQIRYKYLKLGGKKYKYFL
jgi:hypothetical protein